MRRRYGLGALQLGFSIIGPKRVSARGQIRGVGEDGEKGLRLVGAQPVATGRGQIGGGHIVHVRLNQQIGRRLAMQGPHSNADKDHIVIGVGEDVLDDLDPPFAVAGCQTIGRGERASGLIHRKKAHRVGRVAPFDDKARLGHDGDTGGLDLGLMDQAVLGLSQHTLGQGEPYLGPVASRAVGRIGRSHALLRRRRPGRGFALGREGGKTCGD